LPREIESQDLEHALSNCHNEFYFNLAAVIRFATASSSSLHSLMTTSLQLFLLQAGTLLQDAWFSSYVSGCAVLAVMGASHLPRGRSVAPVLIRDPESQDTDTDVQFDTAEALWLFPCREPSVQGDAPNCLLLRCARRFRVASSG
jgi:hypothetical protein